MGLDLRYYEICIREIDMALLDDKVPSSALSTVVTIFILRIDCIDEHIDSLRAVQNNVRLVYNSNNVRFSFPFTRAGLAKLCWNFSFSVHKIQIAAAVFKQKL